MTYLPPKDRKRIRQKAEKIYAYYSLNRRWYLWRLNRDVQPKYNYFLSLLRMHSDWKLVGKTIKLLMQINAYNIKKFINARKPVHQ
jgi:hypothetical protein